MKYRIIIGLLAITNVMLAQPQFIAHRGASYLAPENTVESANLAWELGADAVEVDVHLAKDNRIMVIHDKSTKRTCSGKKNFLIEDTPSMMLRDLDAGVWKDQKFKGEKIPFLSEIIETVPEGKTLFIEIKCGSEIIPHLHRVIELRGKREQLVFICFDWETITNIKKEFPENKCYWLIGSKLGLRRKVENTAESGLDGVNLQYDLIDEETMELAESLRLDVFTWTVDDPEEAGRLSNLGVLGITTNRPKWLKEQIDSL